MQRSQRWRFAATAPIERGERSLAAVCVVAVAVVTLVAAVALVVALLAAAAVLPVAVAVVVRTWAIGETLDVLSLRLFLVVRTAAVAAVAALAIAPVVDTVPRLAPYCRSQATKDKTHCYSTAAAVAADETAVDFRERL